MSLTLKTIKEENDIIKDNTSLYRSVMNIIAFNAPSMIANKTPEELYKIACRSGIGSKIAIAKLKMIYPEHKMTNETIREVIKDYYTYPMNTYPKNTRYKRCGPIEFWDVTDITDMSYLFASNCNFDEDLSRWNVSSVINMNNMFYNIYNFTRDYLSLWDISSVTNIRHIFYCPATDPDLLVKLNLEYGID